MGAWDKDIDYTDASVVLGEVAKGLKENDVEEEKEYPTLLNMLVDISTKFPQKDIVGYPWDESKIKKVYDVFEGEYGTPMQYINKGNILQELIKSYGRYFMGGSFKDEERQFEQYAPFLSLAYSGGDLGADEIEKLIKMGGSKFDKELYQSMDTQEIQEKLRTIYKEYEDKYDFFNIEGEKVIDNIIERNLYELYNKDLYEPLIKKHISQ